MRRFGDLVALLRVDPSNDAAQDLALTAAAAAVAHGVRIDVGVEKSEPPEPLSLQARLLARRVDAIVISPEADLGDLLALARALAHDTMPLPANPHIDIALFPVRPPDEPESPATPESSGAPIRNDRTSGERRTNGDRRRSPRRRGPGADRRSRGERRLHTAERLRTDALRAFESLRQASGRKSASATLNAAHRLALLSPRLPQADRLTVLMRTRRLLGRAGIDLIIDAAERDVASQAAAADVLCWLGAAAAEAMIDRLRAAAVLGPRGFLLDAVGRMPHAYAMIVPLLRSERPYEIRYGAALAARLGRAEAAPMLTARLDHPDETVRVAALEALGRLHHARIAHALRTTLRHPSPVTRSAAADAIVAWRAGALGVLLGTALETERNRHAWHAFVDALGRIGSSSACAALAAVALQRRSLFRRHGYTREQRLAAVAALARARTPVARTALQRLATVAAADPELRASLPSAPSAP